MNKTLEVSIDGGTVQESIRISKKSATDYAVPLSNREAMEGKDRRIGSWNGLTLIRERGDSSSGAHRHDLHMLRLQTHGTTITDWRSRSGSGTTVLQPGSLAVFAANVRHGNCASRPQRQEEVTEQIVALVTGAMLQEAAEAALLPAGSIHLEEKRIFRDLQLERLLWALRDAGVQRDPTGSLVGKC